MRKCWCGNAGLNQFNTEYGRCDTCGTLVFKEEVAAETLLVNDDDSDFYGKQYWLKHQRDSFGYPGIHQRVRSDLTERNLHWLLGLLRYCQPPGRVMELGCSHGSFVALLDHAGFEASGVEMSPWVVEFGCETFGVPVIQGPLESLHLPEASLDAIALMDVLEHLPDPKLTMGHCLRLLKPDGLLLIQTPEFKQEMTFPSLVETQSRFLENLKPVEHLYLFSRESVTRFFHELGADYVCFEPAIFSHYDMFLAVSRSPLKILSMEDADKSLMATSRSRLVLALLDVYRREAEGQARLRTEIVDLENRLTASEADRAARLELIERQGAEIGRLSDGALLDGFRAQLETCEEDRAGRLRVIEDQGARLVACEAELSRLRAELAEGALREQRLRSDLDGRAARAEAKLGTQIRNRLARFRDSGSDDEGR